MRLQVTDPMTKLVVDKETNQIVFSYIDWSYDKTLSKEENEEKLKEAIELFEMYDNGVQNDCLGDFGYKVRVAFDKSNRLHILFLEIYSNDKENKKNKALYVWPLRNNPQIIFVPFRFNKGFTFAGRSKGQPNFKESESMTYGDLEIRYPHTRYEHVDAQKYYWAQTLETALDVQLWEAGFIGKTLAELCQKRVAGNKKYGKIAYNRSPDAFAAVDFYAHGRSELLDLANYLALQLISLNESDFDKNYFKIKELLSDTAALLEKYEKLVNERD